MTGAQRRDTEVASDSADGEACRDKDVPARAESSAPMPASKSSGIEPWPNAVLSLISEHAAVDRPARRFFGEFSGEDGNG